jgi:hypothetical protein
MPLHHVGYEVDGNAVAARNLLAHASSSVNDRKIAALKIGLAPACQARVALAAAPANVLGPGCSPLLISSSCGRERKQVGGRFAPILLKKSPPPFLSMRRRNRILHRTPNRPRKQNSDSKCLARLESEFGSYRPTCLLSASSGVFQHNRRKAVIRFPPLWRKAAGGQQWSRASDTQMREHGSSRP